MQSKIKKTGSLTAAVFIGPFLIIYLLFMVYPIILGLYTSLCEVDISFNQTYIGAANYVEMVKDKYFWESLWNTCVYALLNTPCIVVTGLILALIINTRIKGNIIFRTIYFIPFVLSISVTVSIWVFILQPYTGLLNAILFKLNLISTDPFWIKDPNLVWISIVVMTIWQGIGFNMVMFLAGLRDIDDALYEAARMDGAGALAQFWYITLPSLKKVTLLVTVLQTIASFKLFAHTFMMTRGGPGTMTRSLVQFIYEKAFIQNQMGMASAISFVLLFLILICTAFQFRISAGEKDMVKR